MFSCVQRWTQGKQYNTSDHSAPARNIREGESTERSIVTCHCIGSEPAQIEPSHFKPQSITSLGGTGDFECYPGTLTTLKVENLEKMCLRRKHATEADIVNAVNCCCCSCIFVVVVVAFFACARNRKQSGELLLTWTYNGINLPAEQQAKAVAPKGGGVGAGHPGGGDHGAFLCTPNALRDCNMFSLHRTLVSRHNTSFSRSF
eukprot:SAG31_NODE_6639_length_1943_cov_1.320499_2_plen_203_part_00